MRERIAAARNGVGCRQRNWRIMRFVNRLNDHAVHFDLLDDVDDIAPDGLPRQQPAQQQRSQQDSLHANS